LKWPPLVKDHSPLGPLFFETIKFCM
jgi:hypothetical protein